MDLALTEEQRAVAATFHAFAEREIRPAARDLDERPRFPSELFRRAGELGFFGMRYAPPDGAGADVLSYLLAVEELAWGSLSVAAACTMQSLMGTYFVHRFAQGDVRERLLGPALRGELVGAICMTEPDAGSDLMSIKTRAAEDGGAWRLEGRKTWVTSAPAAGMFTVFARTGDKTLGVFLVEKGAPGLAVGRSIDKHGVRASLTSEVGFEDTPALPLGDPLAGGKYLREILVEIRLMTSALAIGVARAAFEEALAYAKERRQFGRPIADFQAVQAHLAEMAVDLEAARRMTHAAAWRSEQGTPSDALRPPSGIAKRVDPRRGEQEASMAKLFASEAALRVCDRAARVMASYGYATDFPVERYLRDVRFTLIGGGTSEILRVNIAKGLL